MCQFKFAARGLVFVIPVLLVLPASVLAAGGVLPKPFVGIPANSKLRSEDVNQVLGARKFRFVTGSWLNFNSTLYYSGKTADVMAFLDELTRVKGTTVVLRFSKSRGFADTTFWGKDGKSAPCQWRVLHFQDQFTVTVYLGDGSVDIDKLHFPPLKPESDAANSLNPAKSNSQ